MPKSNKQATVRLQLDAEAKAVLDRLAVGRGMTQVAVITRLMAWFGGQDEMIQASALGLVSDETLGLLATARCTPATATVGA